MGTINIAMYMGKSMEGHRPSQNLIVPKRAMPEPIGNQKGNRGQSSRNA